MRCPRCKAKTSVAETRTPRRRRVCSECDFKFHTVELVIGRAFDFRLVMGPHGPVVVHYETQSKVVKDEQS